MQGHEIAVGSKEPIRRCAEVVYTLRTHNAVWPRRGRDRRPLADGIRRNSAARLTSNNTGCAQPSNLPGQGVCSLWWTIRPDQFAGNVARQVARFGARGIAQKGGGKEV
jgi:hypothetical protein